MAKTKVVKPSVIRITFTQEKGDPDYGKCMWANFDLDTENYRLSIMSDCGNYSYNWHPTPEIETFIELCSRFEKGYLLYKLSEKTVIDYESTLKNITKIFKPFENKLGTNWVQEITSIIDRCCGEQEIENSIFEFASNYDIEIDLEEAYCCVEKDYSANTKNIVDVFINHIVPILETGCEQ